MSLQILAVVVFVAILGATYRQLAAGRAATLAETRRQMAQLDMVLAEQAGRAMETVDFVLRSILERRGRVADEPPLSAATLRTRIMGVRQILAVDVATPDGRIEASTRSPGSIAEPNVLPPAGMALLARHAADPKAGLQISEPLRRMDGSWSVLVSRRIDGPDAGFQGIAIAWLNLMYFEDFYKAIELGENGAILLHRRDGLVLARFPHAEQLIGVSFANLPPFRDILSHAIAGTVDMESPVDGTRRILAIRALRAFPLAVNVSVDETSVLASWRQTKWTFAAAATGCGLLLTVLLLMLARRSRANEHLLRETRLAHDAAEAAHAGLVVQMEERERAEAALRQAQRMEAVGQLTGGVAHDFNNLLTIMLGNVELMQANPAASIFAPRLAAMRAAAERGALLTGQLLAFARCQPLMPRAVDLGRAIATMRPLLQSAVGSQIDIALELDPAAPRALVDATQIELVLVNLAINAHDAMPRGGTLTIATSQLHLAASDAPDAPAPGAYVAVRVTDTGCGMAPDILARAFEPFFTTKGPGGSGLGLSQVYGVARQSGGMARIDSTPDKGTSITVILPRAPDRHHPQPPPTDVVPTLAEPMAAAIMA